MTKQTDPRLDTLLSIYRAMLTARTIDLREEALVTQGLAFFHVSGAGHEASAALAPHLRAEDWLHCHYRDKALLLLRGIPIVDFFTGLLCKAGSSSEGRQMSAHLSSPAHNVLSMVGPVGNNALQAVGVAAAVRGRPGQPIVLCSVGDGTTQEGEFLEACAEAVRAALPVLFLIEDNEWAISTATPGKTLFSLPDGAASEFYGMPIERIDGTDAAAACDAFGTIVARMRRERRPALVHFSVKRLADHTNADNQELYRDRAEIERCWFHADPVRRLREHLLERGIPDAALEAMQSEIEDAVLQAQEEALDRGEPATTREAKAPLPPELLSPECEQRGEGPPERTMREALRDVLRHHLQNDNRVYLYGEDIEDPKGDVFGVTKTLSQDFPERVRNAPLSESTIVGTAIGRALAGERPVAFLQFADFLPLAFNQIASELGSMYWRTAGGWQAPVIVMVSCGGYRPGLGPFHSQSLEALAVHTPGIDVFMPSTAADAAGMLNAAFASGRPTLFFYPKAALNRAADATPRDVHRQLVPIGVARTLRQGSDVTLVGWGNTVALCARVAATLQTAGIEADVIDLRSLSPWDKQTVLASAEKTQKLIVVHEDNQSCGLGAEIVATVAEEASVRVRVRRVARPDTLVPCNFANQLEILPSFQRTLGVAAELLDLDLTWEMPAAEADPSCFPVEAIGSGPSDEEIRILRLAVRVGDIVAAGDVLAEVEASKAGFEITSPAAGRVERVMAAEDDVVAVGKPLVILRTQSGVRAKPMTEERCGRALLRRRDRAVEARRAVDREVEPGRDALPARRVGIARVATATGSRHVANEDILAHHPSRTDADVFRRTGIASRFWIGENETLLSLAARAARKVLEQSGLDVHDIDQIICTTVTPDSVSPSLACRVLGELSNTGRPAEAQAFDINAACSGYLYALQIAYDHLQSHPGSRVLVVTSEVLSERLNVNDFDTAFLFGDAASATLLVGESHWDSARFELARPVVSARGDKDHSLYVPLVRNGRAIEMHGARIFPEATRAMLAMLKRACADHRIAVEQLDLIVPHQANQRILDAVEQRVGVPVYSNIRHLGNTSSTTIPLALADLWASTPEGQRLGLCAFGGGFTFGAAILQALEIPQEAGNNDSVSTAPSLSFEMQAPRS